MKKFTVIISLVLALLLCATAFAADIKMESGIDMNDLRDCTVRANFNVKDITDKDITMTVREEVCYDIVDINEMKVGDTIETDDGVVEVKSIDRDEDGQILINGGQDKGGVTLFSEEDTNGFMQRDYEYPAFVNRGTVTVPFADQVTVNVYKMTEDLSIAGEGYDTVTVPAAGVKAEMEKIAAKLGEDFCAEQTRLDIGAGVIVEITVDYMP